MLYFWDCLEIDECYSFELTQKCNTKENKWPLELTYTFLVYIEGDITL